MCGIHTHTHTHHLPYIYIYIHTPYIYHTHHIPHIYTVYIPHTHTMEYHSAIKKNEILPFATTWMHLKGIMLREISQTEKNKYNTISLICGI